MLKITQNNKNTRQLEFHLISKIQLAEELLKKTNVAIMSLKQVPINNMFNISGIRKQLKIETKINPSNLFSNHQFASEKIKPNNFSTIENVLKQYCKILMDKFQNKLSVQSKLIRMQIIVAFQQDSHRVTIIWVKQMQFSSMTNFSFNYEFISQNIETKVSKNSQKQIKIEQVRNIKTEKQNLKDNLIFNQQFQDNIINNNKNTISSTKLLCMGCNIQISSSQQHKQIACEQIKMIRKSHNLSIRGMINDYYQVCSICYNIQQ